jgi:hypothetical protein
MRRRRNSRMDRGSSAGGRKRIWEGWQEGSLGLMIRTWRLSLAKLKKTAKPLRREDYVPPFRPYELTNLMLDLILLARYLLVPKGRLVFFLPTVTEEYEAIDIPVVDGMRELKVGEGSVENFGKWGRRVSGDLSPFTRALSTSQGMRFRCWGPSSDWQNTSRAADWP